VAALALPRTSLLRLCRTPMGKLRPLFAPPFCVLTRWTVRGGRAFVLRSARGRGRP